MRLCYLESEGGPLLGEIRQVVHHRGIIARAVRHTRLLQQLTRAPQLRIRVQGDKRVGLRKAVDLACLLEAKVVARREGAACQRDGEDRCGKRSHEPALRAFAAASSASTSACSASHRAGSWSRAAIQRRASTTLSWAELSSRGA
jgi:hypothetical protein